jgi:phosphatidylserine decarboxylase
MLIDFLARILPLNFLSRITGRIARIQLPGTIQGFLNSLFVRVFGIDLDEAEFPLRHYTSVQDVFTRRLKTGRRPIAEVICSPADGIVTAVGQIVSSTQALAIKGHEYDLSELIWGKINQSAAAEFGWYHVVYLAPHNYHRVHSPIKGEVRLVRHIPGEMWSVSPRLASLVPRLFCRNERLVFEIDDEQGHTIYLVMVAALNVGCMSTLYAPDCVTNQGNPRLSEHRPGHKAVERGGELGIFHLGSTVVTIFPKAYLQRHSFVQCRQNTPILMGQSLITG